MKLSAIKNKLPEKLYARLQLLDHYLNGEPELRLLKDLCDRKRTSLDIGANIGTYTYFMRRYSRRVIAYEPNPDLARRLHRLYPDVQVRMAAASNVMGQVRLRMPVVAGRTMHELASVIEDFSKHSAVVDHIVPAVCIDEESCGDIGFIKIDVELHELAVVQGAHETIRKCKPVILMEVSPLAYPRSLPEMFEQLTRLGYAGWFRSKERYCPFAEYSAAIHAGGTEWGHRLMGNNVIFLPQGYNDAFLPKY